ncbi:cytochrome P450 monooxygenase-like protein [Corynespora cassiicola Philippines]|uniref:Cytochrome P450 monooxygenase-like protein n=1 Tax=Corynespora cassiicola Philippines TaxID=1448308 RepID=A0A2T2NPK6_CORCC|nr:cytochrome P450 monooxygenase-like protein [Corynespora cassiicola Philippines]
MYPPFPSPAFWLKANPVPVPAPIYQIPPWVATSVICILASIFLKFLTKKSNAVLVNAPNWFQPKILKQIEFIKHGKDIFSKGKEYYGNKGFMMVTNVGELVTLPTEFANIIRNDERFSFAAAVQKDFHTHIPGFEPFDAVAYDGQVLQTLVRKQLTKYLNTVSQPLSSEATFAVDLLFGQNNDWREVRIKEPVLDLIARLSSRVFLGDEICRNEEWLKITKEYTLDGFRTAAVMSLVPGPLKRIFSWFSKDCRHLRREVVRARQIITPVIEKRRLLKVQAERNGKDVPTFNDAIDWAEAECGGKPYDAAVLQLTLSVAAIHTTTDLLCQTLLRLADDPSQIQPLREEMITVLKAEGWKKSALYNMKLLDSAIKEAQRLKPLGMVGMRRIVTKDVELPGGLSIRKGERTCVDSTNMRNSAIYPDPYKYDIYRFQRMRDDPATASKAQLVTTSPDHLAFGHGMHACPGRFFAANETKIALCHLLLKYDWKLAPGTNVEPLVFGLQFNINPENKLLYRRRKEEIDLESLEFI